MINNLEVAEMRFVEGLEGGEVADFNGVVGCFPLNILLVKREHNLEITALDVEADICVDFKRGFMRLQEWGLGSSNARHKLTFIEF